MATALLLKANHKEGWFMGRVIRRGQIALGSETFASDLGMSRGAFRRALANLEVDGFCKTEPASKFTIVTVLNYGVYQDKEEDERPTGDTADGTACGTAGEPPSGQLPATNKNGKNNKECVSRVRPREGRGRAVDNFDAEGRGKADKRGDGWTEPGEDAVKEYALAHGKFIDAQRFIGYWSASGWERGGVRVKDWRPLVLTWRDDRDPAAEGWKRSYDAARRRTEDAIKQNGGRLVSGMATRIIEDVRSDLGTFYRPGDHGAYCGAWYGAKAAVDAWKAAR